MFRKAIRLVLISLGAMTSWTLSFLKLLPAGQRADAADSLLSRPVVVDTPHGKIRFSITAAEASARPHHPDQGAGGRQPGSTGWSRAQCSSTSAPMSGC